MAFEYESAPSEVVRIENIRKGKSSVFPKELFLVRVYFQTSGLVRDSLVFELCGSRLALQDPPQNIYLTTLPPPKTATYNIPEPIAAATYISFRSISTQK